MASRGFYARAMPGPLGSPAWAYTAMAVFALVAFAVNWWYYWRRESPTHC